MNLNDKSISDDAVDGLIATPIDADGLIVSPTYSTEMLIPMFRMMLLMG